MLFIRPLYLNFKESFDIVNNVKYDVNDMPKPGLLVGLSFQHLFAMFATVLVPILVGIDPLLLFSHLVWELWLT